MFLLNHYFWPRYNLQGFVGTDINIKKENVSIYHLSITIFLFDFSFSITQTKLIFSVKG